MSQTIAYVRVSTEDQIEFSPEAQAKRCREFARLRDLGPVRVLADEGWSGKNLERPAMQELLELVELGKVSDLVIWLWDRLSRDHGDFAALVKAFDAHAVARASRNDVARARGRAADGIRRRAAGNHDSRCVPERHRARDLGADEIAEDHVV